VKLPATIAVFAFALAASWVTASPCRAASRVITYSIAARGDVGADLTILDRIAREAYADPRGWSLGGAINFKRVSSGGDFILWLASPDAMTLFSDDCSPLWSCRVGRDVVINDGRFRAGSRYWMGAIDDYRVLLVNHETGHWIGFDHNECPGPGAPAPIMMQQSKGVGACVGNSWPLADERIAAEQMLGVRALALPLQVTFDPPRTRGFIALP
jgi:uncharacterized protein DUF3152